MNAPIVVDDTRAELAFELAKLVEKHGSLALLSVLAEACGNAADFLVESKDESAHGSWSAARKNLLSASAHVATAECAADVDLGSSLTVLGDV